MKDKAKKLTGLVILAIIASIFITCTKLSDSNNETILTRKDTLVFTLLYSLNADSVAETSQWLEDMGTRFALAENRRNVATEIKNRFIRLGYPEAALDSFQTVINYKDQEYSTWQYNVTAELRGSDFPDSVNVIGAHYDDIVTSGDPFVTSPGANDNACGVASVLEIARVMKYTEYKPAKSVKFVAFAAQEFGLLGSADFASKLKASGRPVGIVVNSDMIAHETISDKLLWSVDAVFNKNSEDITKESRIISDRYIGLYSDADSTVSKNLDSYSFYRENFKAISFTSEQNDINDHSVNDRSNNCNFTYCILVTGITCGLMVYND